jgi:hypothetical protein
MRDPSARRHVELSAFDAAEIRAPCAIALARIRPSAPHWALARTTPTSAHWLAKQSPILPRASGQHYEPKYSAARHDSRSTRPTGSGRGRQRQAATTLEQIPISVVPQTGYDLLSSRRHSGLAVESENAHRSSSQEQGQAHGSRGTSACQGAPVPVCRAAAPHLKQ